MLALSFLKKSIFRSLDVHHLELSGTGILFYIINIIPVFYEKKDHMIFNRTYNI